MCCYFFFADTMHWKNDMMSDDDVQDEEEECSGGGAEIVAAGLCISTQERKNQWHTHTHKDTHRETNYSVFSLLEHMYVCVSIFMCVQKAQEAKLVERGENDIDMQKSSSSQETAALLLTTP